jgi:hypothetical protein
MYACMYVGRSHRIHCGRKCHRDMHATCMHALTYASTYMHTHINIHAHAHAVLTLYMRCPTVRKISLPHHLARLCVEAINHTRSCHDHSKLLEPKSVRVCMYECMLLCVYVEARNHTRSCHYHSKLLEPKSVCICMYVCLYMFTCNIPNLSPIMS